MYDPKGKDSPENRKKWECVQSFRRGWRDGTKRTVSRDFQFDHRPDLKEAYQLGFNRGTDASIRAMNEYCEEIGYDSRASVLR